MSSLFRGKARPNLDNDPLNNKCVIDTSLLSNFVFTGRAHLLQQLVGGPVHITPAVIDPAETLLPDMLVNPPRSEFLKPLYELSGENGSRYASAAPFIQSFALSAGFLWEPVEMTLQEVKLAHSLTLKSTWDKTTGINPRFKKRGLGAGEAETCAVAISRGWTLLIDDHPALEMMLGLGHNLQTIRTCKLLTLAVERDLMACSDAMNLFNLEIVDRYGFHSTRSKGKERLWFRCDPPRCEWDAA